MGVAPGESAADPKPLPALPSSMLLQDYEVKVLYPWTLNREYAGLPGWKVDTKVRDTGPFIANNYYGTHPAVRIHYSPEMVAWIDGGRKGEVPQGAIIIEEMFNPPAAIYDTLAETPYLRDNPDKYEDLVVDLLSGWTIMIQDKDGDSKDGWFWSGPFKGYSFDAPGGPSNGGRSNVDDGKIVPVSSFGVGTCIRCHASAESGNTFSSQSNYDPALVPLQFKVDNSWRSKHYLDDQASIGATDDAAIKKQESRSVWEIIESHMEDAPAEEWAALQAKLNLPAQQRPFFTPEASGQSPVRNEHAPGGVMAAGSSPDQPLITPNEAFLAGYLDLSLMQAEPGAEERQRFSLPSEYADNVYPSSDPQHYITSSNCMGCHGGLGGAPSGVSMFVATGSDYGDGFNVSPYGEWRWSPMGLAGRDPIFHAQLESEMIILLEENGQLKGGNPGNEEIQGVQQALADTCLRCHGAMGLRQMGLDENKQRIADGEPPLSHGGILDPKFNPEIFYLTEPLTQAEKDDPPFTPYPNQPIPPTHYDKVIDAPYGELAREGISCTVCHHIAPASEEQVADWSAATREKHPSWLGDKAENLWSDAFLYFTANNNTGLYERSRADQILGPLADVVPKPMVHTMGITPVVAPPMTKGKPPFTKDSAMCGTCHTINLPNVGATVDEFPILTALEPNEAFKKFPHSIEQATYLEWLNSKFGPGKMNTPGKDFQSCQDCHMPNRFVTVDANGELTEEINPLASQIATIQDADYTAADHQLPAEDIDVPVRADYSRHELVGLNGFMIEMVKQFPAVLGVSASDYETGAETGPDLAINSMAASIQEGRVGTVAIDTARVTKSGELQVQVSVKNTTGHRLPSGVAFRRAWVSLEVWGEDGALLWASGKPNAGGLITDTAGTVLATEQLRGTAYQPHYQEITDDTQVQIYEELVQNASGDFTTSFIHRVNHIKDNRLLPEGWVTAAEFAGKSEGSDIPDQGDLLYEFMQATEPYGVQGDPEFAASPNSGGDTLRYRISADKLGGKPVQSVTARFYYQSFQPAWFYERFELANKAKQMGYTTPETDRLFYLASHLNLEGTMMEGWKIEIGADSKPLRLQ
jgi:cytochrome c553